MNVEDVVIREHHEPLVQLDPGEFDLKPQYFKRGLTTDSRVWLREGVVEKLRAVKAMLPPSWNIRIWDGWRSMELQRTLYEQVLHQMRSGHTGASEDEIVELTRGYLHPPTESPPPPHTTGGTIDLTLVDASGQALNFGTGFDEFTERAHVNYFDHHASASKSDQEAKTNRQLLRFLMESQDFVVNPFEWWHWEYQTPRWAAAKGIEVARYGLVRPNSY